MSERDNKIKIIERFTELKKKVDKYDRYYYYMNINGRKKSANIVMELSQTGNGYINGRYLNTNGYKTTKRGDLSIKSFSDDEIIKLIEEAIQYIK